MADLFFRRPRLLVLALALILVSGLSAWQVLPRSEDPELVARSALVLTSYPGASAERVESEITDRIEDELSELDEIRHLESTSATGMSIVAIELREEITAVDPVWSRVRAELDDAEVELPAGAGSPRLEESTITAWTLIAGLVWRLDDEPNRAVLGRLAERVEDRLEAVGGTEEVELYGEATEEILVTLDGDRLAALGLTPAELAARLARADSKQPAGLLRGASRDFLVEVQGEFQTLSRVAEVPVRAGADGALARLGEVARIEKTIADPALELATVSGHPAVLVAARMRSDLRVDQWSAEARAALESLRDELPSGIALETLFDQSAYTAERLGGLLDNLALAALLVLTVALAMMGWRAALLIGSALPLTVLMVLAGMRALDVPVHQMSVTGLIIALGLMIDNAIVVVDEVRARARGGATSGEAVAGTVRHLALPLAGSTATTVLAFLPLVIAPGGVNEFVGAMAVVVILAVTSSLVLALTLVPALTGWIERRLPGGGDSWWSRGVSSPALLAAYRRALDAALARPILALALCAALPLAGLGAATRLQEQFFPPTGRDQVQVELRLAEGTPIARTAEVTERARRVLLDSPTVTDVHWVVGRSAPKFYYNQIESEEASPHFAQALVQLRDGEDVVRRIQSLQHRLDEALPEARALVRQLEQGPPFDAPVELRLSGPDLTLLQELGERVRLELTRLPLVTHTRATLSTGRPKLVFAPDDEELSGAGLDRTALAERLQAALVGALGGSLFESGEELAVRVRLTDRERSDVSRLAALELAGQDGWTSLAALGEVALVPEQGSIRRRDGRRVNEVQGFVQAGSLPADTLEPLLARLEAAGFELPAGYALEIGGESAERDQAVGRLAASVSVLIVLMGVALVLSLSSFRRAAVIAAVALLAVGLGLGSLALFGYPFGFMAIVGTLGLIGIAVNDSIVVLTALANDLRAKRGDRVAAREVVVHATRHVLTTTITTVAGFLPLIIATDGMWPPLAVAIAGGVSGATLLALGFVPAAFVLLAGRRERVGAAHPVGMALARG